MLLLLLREEGKEEHVSDSLRLDAAVVTIIVRVGGGVVRTGFSLLWLLWLLLLLCLHRGKHENETRQERIKGKKRGAHWLFICVVR